MVVIIEEAVNESVIIRNVPIVGAIDKAAIVIDKLTNGMAKHLKLMYIKAHFYGMPISKVLVDNGAFVNLLPSHMIKRLTKINADLLEANVAIIGFSKASIQPRGVVPLIIIIGSKSALTAIFIVNTSSRYNALLDRDWIHIFWYVPSFFHQYLIFWNEKDKLEVVEANRKPILMEYNVAKAKFYDLHLVPLKL